GLPHSRRRPAVVHRAWRVGLEQRGRPGRQPRRYRLLLTALAPAPAASRQPLIAGCTTRADTPSSLVGRSLRTGRPGSRDALDLDHTQRRAEGHMGGKPEVVGHMEADAAV